jgi:hypothetical protein
MYPEDVDPESRCRLPLPRREELDGAGRRTYDSLADSTERVNLWILGPSYTRLDISDPLVYYML